MKNPVQSWELITCTILIIGWTSGSTIISSIMVLFALLVTFVYGRSSS
jgi:hypothetical protein